VLYSSTIFDGAAKDELLKSGHVRCAAVDTSHLHLATSGDDKVLKVWRIDGLQLLSARYILTDVHV
jgi:tRNA (guanine-N(7)-)-methyltransferase subunit TRM82